MWEVKGAVVELPCEIRAGEVEVGAGYLRTLLHGEPTAEVAEVAVACLPEVEVALRGAALLDVHRMGKHLW